MAQQVVNPEKLAEAQEAADAAVVAATLAAEKVADISSGDDLTAKPPTPPVENLGKPAEAQEVNGGGMVDGYRVIQNGPQNFSVEGFFSKDGSQRLSVANGFPSEAAARQWVYDQLAAEDR
jgi:hypothetical protein